MNTEKKLSIAIIQQSPDIGGAEMYMKQLVEQFLENGHTVSLVTNRGKYLDLMKPLNIETFTLPFILDFSGNIRGLIKTLLYTPYAVFFYLNLLRRLKKNRVDILLMSSFSEKLFATLLTKIITIPVVWIEYGVLDSVFKRNFYLPKIFYLFIKDIPKYVITASEYTKKSLIRDARISQLKIKLIPCGISTNIGGKEIKEAVPNNTFVIGNVSRATREKGQEYLIKAMPKILKQIPNAHLLLVGDGPDKSYFDTLIHTLHLENHTTMTGFVENQMDYYPLMDVFVFPTIWELEGFGLVVPEAMLHKLPVVGSRIGPVPEVIDDNSTGILVAPADENLLAKTITTLATKKQIRKKMGEAGYEKVIRNYDIRKVSVRVLDVLQEARI